MSRVRLLIGTQSVALLGKAPTQVYAEVRRLSWRPKAPTFQPNSMNLPRRS
jgi:hypothetical protein